jgi:myo-inositol 2-dehydrogenase/D-chiro-inositol 1-dehydrogenase
MFYEEISICGNEGYLKAYEREDFLSIPRPKTHLEILRGENHPARVTSPCYPPHIEESGHNGATFFEHTNLIDNLDGKDTNTATVEEGFWSVMVGAAAEESVKTGQPVMVDEMLKRNGIPL